MPGRTDALAEAYSAARPRLVGVAYAIVGGYAEAEDVVAECWLRLVDAERRDPVRDVEGWAVVAVGRAAVDVLRSARRRRETYPGAWLPEPVVDIDQDPADRVGLDDHVRYAVLVMMESLSPAERTAWVLHDMFELPFPDVARIVGRTPAAVRQLAARARRHMAQPVARFDVTQAEHRVAVERFLAAAEGGDLVALVRVLDPEVVLTSDGGGVVRAAPHPVVGSDRVARFLLGLMGKHRPVQPPVVVTVNGAPGLAVLSGSELTDVLAFTLAGGRITRIDWVRAPAKLARAVRRPAAS